MVSRFVVVLLFATNFSSTSLKANILDQFGTLMKPAPTSTVGFNRTINLTTYMNANELEYLLKELSKKYNNIMKVVRIGKSAVDKTPIWAVEITKNVQQPRELLKPMFKFVANVHGDETVGYALMVSLLQYLVYKYDDKQDQSVKKILDEIDVWIIPTLNPDGLSRAKEGNCESVRDGRGRYNGNGVDIDGEFNIDYRSAWWFPQIETLKFILKRPFVLSGNLQGGLIDASLPPVIKPQIMTRWRDNVNSRLVQDNLFLETLASEYAAWNPMFDGTPSIGPLLPNEKGLSNFNYINTNCFQLNLELGHCKYPLARDLPYYWIANMDAMLNLIKSTRRGVYGLVVDTRGRPIRKAVIAVLGMEKEVTVTKHGEYWRLLLPGLYNISAKAPGYETRSYMKLIDLHETYVRQDFSLTLTKKSFIQSLLRPTIKKEKVYVL